MTEKEGEYLIMTPNMPNWDPHTDIYKDQEYAMMDYNGNVKKRSKINSLVTKTSLNAAIGEIGRTDVDVSSNNFFILSVNLLDKMEKGITIYSVNSGQRKKRITAEEIARKLNIPYEMAKRTLQATTQLGVRTTEEPSLTRKYSTNDRMLRYCRLLYDSFMDTFFATKKAKSIRGFKSCQSFATEFGHLFSVLMEDKSGKNIALAIKRYFKEVGVPMKLICDQASE